jgi:cytidine deaminase
MDRDELVARAREAMERAYAPYSGFRVGAALLAEDGSIYTGCNVENASYGLTVCAERVAVVNAVAGGARQYRGLAIVTEGSKAVAPCGACRQVLSEFSPRLQVVSEAGGERREWALGELLPEPFERSFREPFVNKRPE